MRWGGVLVVIGSGCVKQECVGLEWVFARQSVLNRAKTACTGHFWRRQAPKFLFYATTRTTDARVMTELPRLAG
jgi:hypothetical protein